jgi:hypothetical protein
MSTTPSERRLIKNEITFRNANQSVQKSLVRLQKSAEIEGLKLENDADDLPLHFYCECSDTKCRQRIVIKPKLYRKLHADEKYFIVLPGHETPKVEKVVKRTKNYLIVEKPAVAKK